MALSIPSGRLSHRLVHHGLGSYRAQPRVQAASGPDHRCRADFRALSTNAGGGGQADASALTLGQEQRCLLSGVRRAPSTRLAAAPSRRRTADAAPFPLRAKRTTPRRGRSSTSTGIARTAVTFDDVALAEESVLAIRWCPNYLWTSMLTSFREWVANEESANTPRLGNCNVLTRNARGLESL